MQHTNSLGPGALSLCWLLIFDAEPKPGLASHFVSPIWLQIFFFPRARFFPFQIPDRKLISCWKLKLDLF